MPRAQHGNDIHIILGVINETTTVIVGRPYITRLTALLPHALSATAQVTLRCVRSSNVT